MTGRILLLLTTLVIFLAAAQQAQARCSYSRDDACFRFTVKGELAARGSWTNTDCSGGASGSGSWSETDTYRTLKRGTLKVHRWHPRKLFTFEQKNSGSPPFAPAQLDVERQSSSATDSSCGDPDPPTDCGKRTRRYRQQLMTMRATRGLRLDFFDLDTPRYAGCNADAPDPRSFTSLPRYELRRFFGKRKLVIRGGGTRPLHETDSSGTRDSTFTVNWTLTLVRIR